MFSGIIAACGRIEHVEPLADGIRITVHAAGLDCADLAPGDSVANSGVCLTITQLDATAHWIARRLHAQPIRISRIARGVPVGGELEYTDPGTLAQAILERRTMQDAAC